MNCAIKGQFYLVVSLSFSINSSLKFHGKNFGSHSMTLLYPNLCYNEVHKHRQDNSNFEKVNDHIMNFLVFQMSMSVLRHQDCVMEASVRILQDLSHVSVQLAQDLVANTRCVKVYNDSYALAIVT